MLSGPGDTVTAWAADNHYAYLPLNSRLDFLVPRCAFGASAFTYDQHGHLGWADVPTSRRRPFRLPCTVAAT